MKDYKATWSAGSASKLTPSSSTVSVVHSWASRVVEKHEVVRATPLHFWQLDTSSHAFTEARNRFRDSLLVPFYTPPPASTLSAFVELPATDGFSSIPSSLRDGPDPRDDSLKDTLVSAVQDELGLIDGEVVYTSGYSPDVATSLKPMLKHLLDVKRQVRNHLISRSLASHL
ncbi:unnamed protein product [Cyclocybe aegerita]|uniref:Uncharacterized protein n=1 Tax=Cyclocybe aegerita TaxID=1973307 RepID=A0A8S0X3M6_CYCAE|nr:unnamed protein product [Cyclocybe aegerita]